MATLNFDGTGDETRRTAPRQQDGYSAYQPPAVPRQPTQVWEQPSTPAPYQAPQQQAPWYTPPPNAGSWNDYYRQPGTTQPVYDPYGQPMQPVGQAPQSGLGNYASQLEGFNADKLNDPTHQTAKYQFARVASRYAPTQQGFAQLVADPEFQQLGMQSLGNGNIRLPNGEVIDVVRGFQSGGQAWQWGPQAEAAPQAPAAAPAASWSYDPWASYGYGYGGGYDPYAAYYASYQQPAMDPYAGYYSQPAPQPASPAPSPAPQPQVQDPYAGYGYSIPSYPQTGYGGGYGYGYSGPVTVQGAQSGMAQALPYMAQGIPYPYYYG